MNPRVIDVKPGPDFTLVVIFANKEKRLFDVKPYLEKGIFKDLKKNEIFNSVKVDNGAISWTGGQDFGPDTLYIEGRIVN
jgi:hypothetical protein